MSRWLYQLSYGPDEGSIPSHFLTPRVHFVNHYSINSR